MVTNGGRYEYKFVVPVEKIERLRVLIEPYMEPDPFMKFGDREGYLVRSIYFDTPRYDYYHEKVEGVGKRIKVRIRGYNDYSPDSTVFLELKRKNNRVISKCRAPLLAREVAGILSGDILPSGLSPLGKSPELREDSVFRFLYHYYRDNLSPTVLVMYRREAFVGKYDTSLRITFDKNLTGLPYPTIGQLFENPRTRYSNPGFFVLEVKFSRVFPPWMNRINTLLNLQLGSFSKYVSCVMDHIPVGGHTRLVPYDYLADR